MNEEFDIEAFLAQEAYEASLLAQATSSAPIQLIDYPDFFATVWPANSSDIVPGWRSQTLSAEGLNSFGIRQPVNGPCGVLAVFLGVIAARRLKENGFVDVLLPLSGKEIAWAIVELLSLHVKFNQRKVRICTWKDTVGRNVNINEMEIELAESWLIENIESFKGEGSLLLLLYSIVATKGESEIKKELNSSGFNLTLVESTLKPDIWFCSSELMTLLLRGSADGNLGCYDAMGKKRQLSPRKTLDVGLLSLKERETRIPILDELKSPRLPVWVLHSGDHFTTMFASSLNTENEFYIWNGLPPAGPRLSLVEIKFGKLAEPAPSIIPQTDYVPLPGEIEDVVQSDPDDKKKFAKDFTKWRFEILLAIDDPSIKGPERPLDILPVVFSLGNKPEGKWRCASCYRTRFKTSIFGMNSVEDVEVCRFCGKTKEEAQWTIWVDYKQLPNGWQKSLAFHHGPKLLAILSTKWLDIQIIKPGIDDIPSL